jgi:Ca2+/H+ antiporter
MYRSAGTGMMVGGAILAAIGAILEFAVTVTATGFNINTVGMILLIVGIVLFVAGLGALIAGSNRRTTVHQDVHNTPTGQARTEEYDERAM